MRKKKSPSGFLSWTIVSSSSSTLSSSGGDTYPHENDSSSSLFLPLCFLTARHVQNGKTYWWDPDPNITAGPSLSCILSNQLVLERLLFLKCDPLMLRSCLKLLPHPWISRLKETYCWVFVSPNLQFESNLDSSWSSVWHFKQIYFTVVSLGSFSKPKILLILNRQHQEWDCAEMYHKLKTRGNLKFIQKQNTL